jgi:hypothetical protein
MRGPGHPGIAAAASSYGPRKPKNRRRRTKPPVTNLTNRPAVSKLDGNQPISDRPLPVVVSCNLIAETLFISRAWVKHGNCGKKH